MSRFLAFGLALALIASARIATAAAPEDAASSDSQRYGPFGLLDRRSTYGTYFFPEPLRADEMDIDREFRIDYFHGENQNRQEDEVKAELEWNFGLLTIEAELPYERESESEVDPISGMISHNNSDGIGNIALAARFPVFECVDPVRHWDYTLAAGLEVAIPSGSKISKDTEIVPTIFNLIRVGQHLSIQASAGYSMLIGPEEGGTNTLETDLVCGYNLDHNELPLPHVLSTVPIFELNNETTLSGDENWNNALFGTIGARFNFESLGPAQPRLGLGYVFPIDHGARGEMDWGVVVSVVFEL
jgi:hypothetical protein